MRIFTNSRISEFASLHFCEFESMRIIEFARSYEFAKLRVCDIYEFGDFPICEFASSKNVWICEFAHWPFYTFANLQICEFVNLQICESANSWISKFVSLGKITFENVYCFWEYMCIWPYALSTPPPMPPHLNVARLRDSGTRKRDTPATLGWGMQGGAPYVKPRLCYLGIVMLNTCLC